MKGLRPARSSRPTTPLSCSPMRAWCSSKTSSRAKRSGHIRARPRRRSASVSAGSTTTSRTSGLPRATTPSSRCSGTSRSATTSSATRSSSRWDYFIDTLALDPERIVVTVFGGRERACASRRRGRGDLERRHGLSERAHHPLRRQRKLLADGRHRPLRPVLRDSLLPMASTTSIRVPLVKSRPRTAEVGSSSGTSSSCSSSATGTARWTRCPPPRSTPAPGSSASQSSNRGS